MTWEPSDEGEPLLSLSLSSNRELWSDVTPLVRYHPESIWTPSQTRSNWPLSADLPRDGQTPPTPPLFPRAFFWPGAKTRTTTRRDGMWRWGIWPPQQTF